MPSTTNRNARGGSHERRRRRRWLLSAEAGFGGDGEKVPCAFGCGTLLSFETVTADRYPIDGADGGTYRRSNIRPACGPCNYADGGRKGNARKLAQVICYVEELVVDETMEWRQQDALKELQGAALMWATDGDHKARVRLRKAISAASLIDIDDLITAAYDRGRNAGEEAERALHE